MLIARYILLIQWQGFLFIYNQNLRTLYQYNFLRKLFMFFSFLTIFDWFYQFNGVASPSGKSAWPVFLFRIVKVARPSLRDHEISLDNYLHIVPTLLSRSFAFWWVLFNIKREEKCEFDFFNLTSTLGIHSHHDTRARF